MRDYLENKIDFNKIAFSSIERFLGEVKEYNNSDYKHLRKVLERTISNLDSVSSFLEALGVLKIKKKLLVEQEFLTNSPEILKGMVLERLFQRLYPRSNAVHELIDSIVYLDGQYWYMPNQSERVKFSGIRNFLHELNFLEYKSKLDRYLIAKPGEIFLKNLNDYEVSPEELEEKLLKLKKLGDEAEKAVLVYEKNKLRDHPELVEQIKHTAKRTTNAGYDIHSYDPLNFEEMYIEVKAVSENDRGFYWTKNEMKKAKILGAQYYLYLVPATKGILNMKKLLIIQNPYINVYKNEKQWLSGVELMTFSRIE